MYVLDVVTNLPRSKADTHWIFLESSGKRIFFLAFLSLIADRVDQWEKPATRTEERLVVVDQQSKSGRSATPPGAIHPNTANRYWIKSCSAYCLQASGI
jgi:hypothetical protein